MQEHSLEVQVPFLQMVASRPFQLLPIALGRMPGEGLEPIIAGLEEVVRWWRGEGLHTVVIASSDTYHGYDARACRDNDERLMKMIEAMETDALLDQFARREVMACGWMGLVVAMELARRVGRGRGRVARREDSGNAGGASRGYVVGYVGAVFE